MYQCIGLDNILIAIKQQLILQREDKRYISQEELVSTIKSIISIEKYNAVKHNNNKHLDKIWEWIESKISHL